MVTIDECEQVHLAHCYHGEYEGSCIYGDEDCPARPNPRLGSSLDDFLKEEGILDEVNAGAAKRVKKMSAVAELKKTVRAILLGGTTYNAIALIDHAIDCYKKDVASGALVPPKSPYSPDDRSVLKDLLQQYDDETCRHEETKRGGSIWTICVDCDRKWADDRGGFVPYQDAPAVAVARRIVE